ncbi:MAG: PAS domain S-box protein [Kiritimatiellae bacterium]|nr:PAS domain S-box protein [Kiritimatiellia bacterium]MDD5522718.1 PAS domain S-box protein [Kiritimatiellia bacterium]
MNIKSQILLLMSFLIIITASTFSWIGYQSSKKALLEGIDNKLLTAACFAKTILSDNYHDTLIDKNSISPEEFDRMVDRNNKLCLSLDLQYIWSVMIVSNQIVFTSATSPEKDIKKGDHARFFDVHRNPSAFDNVFGTMKTDYSSFTNEWGTGRMVLVPGTDKTGRKYCFGASMDTGNINKILTNTMRESFLLFLIILTVGICTSYYLAGVLSRPVIKLTSIAKKITSGDYNQKIDIGGGKEVKSLSESIATMSLAIREKLATICESVELFRRVFDEGLIGVVIIGRDLKFLKVNPTFCRITGYSQEELTSMTFPEITHPDHIEKDSENIKKLANGEIPYYRTEKRYYRKDGAVIWVSLVASAIRDNTGNLLYFLTMTEDITDKKQLNEELRCNEEKFRSLFENMTEGMTLNEVIYDAKGKAVNYRIVDVNPAFEKHTGISPVTAKGKLATELYGTESAPYLPLWANVAETGKPHHTEIYFGSVKRHLDVACFSPRKGWFATVFTDITERVQIADQLRQSEEKFRSLVETSNEWIWELNEKGIGTYSSPSVKTLLGYGPEDVIGKTPLDFILPEDRKEFATIHNKIFKSRKPFVHVLYRCLHKNGSIIILEGSGVPFFDSNGRFKGYRGINRNITERKRMEEQITKLSFLKERLIGTQSLNEILKIVTDGIVEFLGADFARIWLIEEGDLCEKGCFNGEFSEGPNVCRDRTRCLHLVASSGRYTHIDGNHRRVPVGCYKIGRVASEEDPWFVTNDVTNDPRVHDHVWAQSLGLVSFAGFKLTSEEGRPIGVLALFNKQPISSFGEGLLKDLTNYLSQVIMSKKSLEALQKSETKFRTIFENANDAIFLMKDDIFVDCNTKTLQMFQCARDQIIGQSPYRFSPPLQPDGRDSKEKALEKINAALAGNHQYFDWKHCLYDGTLFDAEVSLNPIVLGGNLFIQAIVRDVTEHKKAEQAILELNRDLEQRVKDRTLRLELANKELNAFAYSVSHDLRAPLRSIDGFSKAVLEDFSDKLNDEGRDYLQRLRRASQHMAALIDDLLKLFRVTSSELNISDVNLSLIAETAITGLRKTDHQRNVEIIIPPEIKIKADPHLMLVVMENLLGNAWKFTSKKQKARIELGVFEKNKQVIYYVRDNGAGFDMAFVHKLFGAFQRLHSVEDYPGDGIGLASVQRIIHRHGGWIWAEGKPDEGATFYFTLDSGTTVTKEV